MIDPPPTLLAASARLRQDQTTALELVESCLARIDRYDAHIHAWVTVDADGARQQAQLLDHELQAGKARGPLHGIPIGVKDIVDVRGLPTRVGLKSTTNQTATHDAAVVAHLRAAGAIILGKTVTTQWAFLDPPPTRNPWNVERTPGGSSSGSAAAVACRMCLAAIGTQTGGSLTRPATYCGVAACKPTWGRVSVRGVRPLAFHLDHVGAIAADCTGLAAMLDAMAAYDAQDALSIDAESPHCLPSLHTPRSAPIHLGLLTGFFRDEASAAVLQATDAAIATLTSAGANVTHVAPPFSVRKILEDQMVVMAIEAAMAHRERYAARRSEYGKSIAALLDAGLAATAVDYAEALERREQFRREAAELLNEFDALVSPAATTTAPGCETTGNTKLNAPFSHVGLPTISIPCAVADDGLPVGLQFIGRAWCEAELLRTAQWCEEQIGFSAQPALP